MAEDASSPLGNVISIDDDRIKSHLDRVVRGTVEETLNALLDAEGGSPLQCAAIRAQRGASRHARRSLRAQPADQGR